MGARVRLKRECLVATLLCAVLRYVDPTSRVWDWVQDSLRDSAHESHAERGSSVYIMLVCCRGIVCAVLQLCVTRVHEAEEVGASMKWNLEESRVLIYHFR